MRRALLAAAVTAALLAGCTPGDQPGDAAPGGEASSASEPVGDPTGTEEGSPPEGGPDEQFGFDDTAEFEDGLLVEVAGATAVRAKPGQKGAELTSGEMIIISVRLENQTPRVYNAEPVLITVTYGTEDLDAALVTDPAGELQAGFSGAVEVGQELTAVLGFAVPFSELARVTVTVDRDDPTYEPVSFTGAVERE